MIAAQPCLTETPGKILGKGGEKHVEQNVVENDGFGKTIFGKAQSNVRHHAQARCTEYFLKEGEHNQSQDAASSDTISVQPHFGRISRVLSKKACQTTSFLVVMRFVCLFSQPHRGNVEIRHHVPEFEGSLRPEQTRLFFMCLPWKS